MDKRTSEAALMQSIHDREVFSTINALRQLMNPIDSCGVKKLEIGRQVTDEYLWVQIDGKVQKRDFIGALRYAETIWQRKHICST